MAVAAPELHVRTLADEDVAKGGVPRVAGPGEHHIHAVDLPGEQHAVAVIGQEGVLQLAEGLEVPRPAHADGGAVIAVAPCNVVLPVDLAHPGVIPVLPGGDLRVVAQEMDGVVLDLPVDAVPAEAGENVHTDGPAVAAEHAGEAVLVGDHRAVEYAVGPLDGVAADDGVAGKAPDRHVVSCGLLLPGDVFQFISNYFTHNRSSDLLCV